MQPSMAISLSLGVRSEVDKCQAWNLFRFHLINRFIFAGQVRKDGVKLNFITTLLLFNIFKSQKMTDGYTSIGQNLIKMYLKNPKAL